MDSFTPKSDVYTPIPQKLEAKLELIQKEAHAQKNAYSKSVKTDLKFQAEVVRLKEENKTLKRDVKNLQAQLDAKDLQISKLEEQFFYLSAKTAESAIAHKKRKGRASRAKSPSTSSDPSYASDSSASESDSGSSTEKTKKKKKKSTKKESKEGI